MIAPCSITESSPVNGAPPQSASYAITPSAHRSHRGEAERPRNCSGDIYFIVPTTTPVIVSLLSFAASSSLFAMPCTRICATPHTSPHRFHRLVCASHPAPHARPFHVAPPHPFLSPVYAASHARSAPTYPSPVVSSHLRRVPVAHLVPPRDHPPKAAPACISLPRISN